MIKRMKKSLVVLLALATVASMSAVAFAVPRSLPPGSSDTPIVATEESTGTSAISATTVVEVPSIPTTSSVAGIKSTVGGAFLAKSVSGVAVTAPVADLKAALGVASNESLYLAVYDVTAKKNPASSALLDAVAASQNAVVVTKIEMDFAKRTGNKLQMLNGGAVPMLIALNAKDFVAGANYAVVRVAAGGAVSIIPAVVNESGILAFEAVAGQAAYAIIRY